jgi:hypothetical protein
MKTVRSLMMVSMVALLLGSLTVELQAQGRGNGNGRGNNKERTEAMIREIRIKAVTIATIIIAIIHAMTTGIISQSDM